MVQLNYRPTRVGNLYGQIDFSMWIHAVVECVFHDSKYTEVKALHQRTLAWPATSACRPLRYMRHLRRYYCPPSVE